MVWWEWGKHCTVTTKIPCFLGFQIWFQILELCPRPRGEFLPRAALTEEKRFCQHLSFSIILLCIIITLYYYKVKLLNPKSALIWEAGMLCLHWGQRLMFKLHLGYRRSWNVGYQGRRSGSHWHSGKERARALNSTKFHLGTLITSLNTPNTIRYMLLIGWWQAVKVTDSSY